MRKRIDTVLYIVLDYLAASASWILFFLYRRYVIEMPLIGERFRLVDKNFILGALLIPLFWIFLYALLGTYKDVYRKSRLNELGKTLLASFIGVLIIFFILLLDDYVPGYRTYYLSLAVLFLTHSIITFLVRFIQLTSIGRRLRSGKIGFRTLIVGGGERALTLYDEIQRHRPRLGYFFQGFINPNGKKHNFVLEKELSCVGRLSDLEELIKTENVEEVIIALEQKEHKIFRELISILESSQVIIKIIPDMYDIMVGHVKMQQIFGAILIEIYPEMMPYWQKILKRLIDVVASLLALIILSPLMIYAAIRVKLSSDGPVLFKQRRIGKDGKPFNILKFRSMKVDAESNGPALSFENDPRITKWGQVMRKWRIDELPQFYNVLIGEMSLVGPRPERQHYIDLIKEQAPHYRHLLKVRPGITSWGQVKFGYATSVKEMVQRLKFDILYIENMSLLVDFKIMIYTVLIILQGRGK